MKPGAKVEETLEALGHHDVLDLRQSHSREAGARSQGSVFLRGLSPGLGRRRLFEFRAVHFETLKALRIEASGACLGRVQRLLGDEKAAAGLRAACKKDGSSRAAGWLGELLVFADPKTAKPALEAAVRLDPKWAWPHLWLSLLVRAEPGERSRRERELFFEKNEKDGGAMPFIAHYLTFHDLLERRELDAALEEAKKAIALDGLCPAGYDMAGQARYQAGDLAGARGFFHQARNHDLDVEGVFLFKSFGVELNWTDAKAYGESLDRAIKKHPREAVLYAERAELKRSPTICLYEEALADYAKAAELSPDCAWIVAVLARAENNLKGGSAGMSHFDRAIELCPDSGWMRAWRGAARARARDQEGALVDFGKAAELMPWYSFTFAWRGALCNALGRFAQARLDLDKAIRLDPHYQFSFYERFQACRGLKDYAAAVEDLNVSFRADPKYTWLGREKPGPVKDSKAARELDEAVKSQPKSAWLRAWRGYTLLQLGQAEAAGAELDMAVKLDAKSALFYAWRGAARCDAGQPDQARADLEKAVALDPKLWTAHRTLSELSAAAGDLRKALAAMTKVVELVPTTIACLMSKAQLAHQLGRDAEAESDLEKATQLDPGFRLGWAWLARVQLARGEQAKAEASVGRALADAAPPGLAFLVRGLIRQQKGDFAGQIEDFKSALAADPGLFPGPQRAAVEELVRGGARG